MGKTARWRGVGRLLKVYGSRTAVRGIWLQGGMVPFAGEAYRANEVGVRMEGMAEKTDDRAANDGAHISAVVYHGLKGALA